MSESMHEPISWLLLERYALGELEGEQRADVERRLAASEADRACLDAIQADDTALPPLPVPLRKRSRVHAGWWAGALGVAAALALAVVRPATEIPARREVFDGVKGGEVALLLHSERTGPSPRRFRDGERFKLLVTCPAWLSSRLSVVVFQGGERYRPLAPIPDFPCGNSVPWPGAFALDGDGDVEVCVSWASHDGEDARALEPEVVCERLEHEGSAEK